MLTARPGGAAGRRLEGRVEQARTRGRQRAPQHGPLARQGPVDHREALGVGARELELLAHRPWNSRPARRAGPASRPGARPGLVGTSSRIVRWGARRPPTRQGRDLIGLQLPPRTLIGDGGVEEAVPEHEAAACEMRPHDGGDVVGAVGRVQQRLGTGIDVLPVQQQLADALPERGAARLAGGEHEVLVDGALGDQMVVQHLHLGGLARPVPALEGDEHAAARRMGGRHAQRRHAEGAIAEGVIAERVVLLEQAHAASSPG